MIYIERFISSFYILVNIELIKQYDFVYLVIFFLNKKLRLNRLNLVGVCKMCIIFGILYFLFFMYFYFINCIIYRMIYVKCVIRGEG